MPSSAGFRTLGDVTGKATEELAARRRALLESMTPEARAELEAKYAPKNDCDYCGGRMFIQPGVTGGNVALPEDIPCPVCNPKTPDGAPQAYRSWTFETFKGDALACAAVKEWVEDGAPGPGLLLRGATGRGKTGLAVAAMRALAANGRRGLFANTSELLDELRGAIATNETSETFARYRTAPVLVLDDIAAPKESEFAAERVYSLIDGRERDELVTIVTSDQDAAVIEAMYDRRVASRLMAYRRVQMVGDDLRGKK